jgi:hypothetical protein
MTLRCATLNPRSLFTFSIKFRFPTAIAPDHLRSLATLSGVNESFTPLNSQQNKCVLVAVHSANFVRRFFHAFFSLLKILLWIATGSISAAMIVRAVATS